MLASPGWAAPREFNIPAKDAVEAIPEFARQAGLLIVAPASTLQGVRTPAVRGNMEPREALARLLEGTSLKVVSDDGRVITLSQAGSRDPAASAEPERGLEEIIVTAQRRAESAQRAALAIQAISAEELARSGVTRPEDLNTVATGVQIGFSAINPQVFLRGIGTLAANVYSEGAVSMNIDGTHVARGWATRGTFFDLDRIEVLKGPQGTLYGRNASGGALNIITKRPTFDGINGYVEGELGNFERARGTAAINIPINDVLAVRAAGQVIHQNGYLEDGYSDDKSQAGRLHVLYKPNGDFSLLLSGGYQHIGGKGPGWTSLPALQGTSPWLGLANPQFNQLLSNFGSLGVALGLIPPGGSIKPMAQDGFADVNLWSASAEMNWNMGWATLTVIPAFRHSTQSVRHYNSVQSNYDEYAVQHSMETRLSNQNDRLKWVAGLYFFDERQGNLAGKFIGYQDSGAFLASTEGPVELRNTSAAAFGQMTYSILPSLRLTAGLRYTYEHKKQNGIEARYGATPPAGPCDEAFVNNLFEQAPYGCQHSFGGRLSFYNVSYKAGLEYDLAPRSLLYVSYSTGFKSGGFTYVTSPTFKPERLNAWELGVKNRFFNNRLQANIELFYWRYLNHQESYIGYTDTGILTGITQNAGVARSYGVSADFVYAPTNNDRFTLGVQWNPTTYLNFKYSGAANPPPQTNCALGPVSGLTQEVDCGGQQMARAPLWTGNAGYEHDFDLKNGALVTASVDTQFASSSYLGLEFLPLEKQRAYYIVNSSLTYTAPDEKWSISAWGRNLTDEAVYDSALPSPVLLGKNVAAIRPPRTYGVRARINF